MPMSKRRQARVFRGVQYGVLVVAIIVLAVVADWGEITRAFFNVPIAAGLFPEMLSTALLNTIIYSAMGFGFGLALAVPLALMKLSSVPPYRWIATGYIEFFRGIPALLVFITFGFGIPLAFQLRFDIYSAAMLSLGLVGAAYMAETIRAGIQAVDVGQVEAARSLGMSAGRTTVTIVIPQAFRIVLPPLTNELILLTKDSSLIYLLGLAATQNDLVQFSREAASTNVSLTPLLVAGLCYLVITVPLAYLSRRLERRTGGKRISTPESTGLAVQA